MTVYTFLSRVKKVVEIFRNIFNQHIWLCNFYCLVFDLPEPYMWINSCLHISSAFWLCFSMSTFWRGSIKITKQPNGRLQNKESFWALYYMISMSAPHPGTIYLWRLAIVYSLYTYNSVVCSLWMYWLYCSAANHNTEAAHKFKYRLN